jgi:NAD-dependent SIR2 family protein deacetylase
MRSLQRHIDLLYRFIIEHPSLVVLTGAGISAPSGIPTYRDERGTWMHSKPIQHQEFLREPAMRQRYWARSLLGWPAVRDANPNAAHHALETLERLGRVSLLITQNVDRLHQRAGSHNVVDLHGRLDRVICLNCSTGHLREQIQDQLARDNGLLETGIASQRPDGDANADEDWVRQIRTPGCSACGGLLMPDVVFFGGQVPPERVRTCISAVEQADAVLAIGSSLQVFSGFRFCREANRLGKGLALINPGKTRADDMAGLKLSCECGPVLQGVASRFG